jgi:hypothetical protein
MKFMLSIITLLLLSTLASQGQTPAPSPAPECADYPSQLDACAAYACTFRHPITGQMTERRIVGLQGAACATVEQMPNGGRMECSLTPGMRQSMAEFYRTTMAGGTTQTSTRTNLGTGATTTSTSVNGAAAANPLNDALQSGACKVVGYGAAPKAASAATSAASAATPAAATPAAAATVTGTLSLGGTRFPLTHARAIAQPDTRDRTRQQTLVVLSDVPLTEAQAVSPGQLQTLAKANQLHAVAFVVRGSNEIASVLLYDSRLGSAGTVSVPPATVKLEPGTPAAGAIAGAISTLQPGNRLNVAYEFSLTFTAPVQK